MRLLTIKPVEWVQSLMIIPLFEQAAKALDIEFVYQDQNEIFPDKDDIVLGRIDSIADLKEKHPSLKVIGLEQGIVFDSIFVYPDIYELSYMSELFDGMIDQVIPNFHMVEQWWKKTAAQTMKTKCYQVVSQQMLDYLSEFRSFDYSRQHIVLAMQYDYERSFKFHKFDYDNFLKEVAIFCDVNRIPLVVRPHPQHWAYGVDKLRMLANLCDIYVSPLPLREMGKGALAVINADSLPVQVDALFAHTQPVTCCQNSFSSCLVCHYNIDVETALWQAINSPVDIMRQKCFLWLLSECIIFRNSDKCLTKKLYDQILSFMIWFINYPKVPFFVCW